MNLPGIYPWMVDEWPGPEEDHAFHEFAGLGVTDGPSTDDRRREDFVEDVERAAL